MVKLAALPSLAVIAGFKGTVDYYEWMGIPVARQWPRSPGKVRSKEVEAQWPAFRYAAQEWKNLAADVQQAYKTLAESSGLDGRDLFTRGYLSGLYRYETP
jgi:hypothetical protein